MRNALRKSIKYLLFLCVCCLSFAFCFACKDDTPTLKKSIALANSAYTIDYNSRMQLSDPKVSGFLTYELEWSSSNEAVITVNENGQIRSYATAGESTITVTVKGTQISTSCVVSVVAQGGKIPAMLLTNVDNNEALNLYVGSEYTVNAKVLYANNEVACDIAAYSEDTQIVTTNGLTLTAAAVGSVDVQIKTTVFGVECVEILTVNVIDKVVPVYSHYEVNLICEADETEKVSLEKILVNDIAQSLDGVAIEYSIDKSEIAEISQNGNEIVVTAQRFGKATVSAKYTLPYGA